MISTMAALSPSVKIPRHRCKRTRTRTTTAHTTASARRRLPDYKRQRPWAVHHQNEDQAPAILPSTPPRGRTSDNDHRPPPTRAVGPKCGTDGSAGMYSKMQRGQRVPLAQRFKGWRAPNNPAAPKEERRQLGSESVVGCQYTALRKMTLALPSEFFN